MRDKVFIDTNILIYCYSENEPEKRQIAQELVGKSQSVISTQVVHELVNILTKKFKVSWTDAAGVVKECLKNSDLHVNSISTTMLSCSLASRYRYSFYDSLIIAAAIESDCKILFSEDLSNGQVIDDHVLIKNPLLP